MDSIIVKIQNGLGNQMSQYALGRRLSLLNNCPLKFDFSQYDATNRNFQGIEFNLYRFNIKGEIAEKSEFEGLFPKKSNIKNRLLRGLHRRIYKHLGKFSFYKKKYIEDIWDNSEKVLKAKPPCYLKGHWFNLAFFEDVRSLLIDELSLKNELRNDYFYMLLKKINESDNSIGIHFRTKYAFHPNLTYVVLDLDYYYQSIQYLKQSIGELNLFVFSDDIEWVKENFKPDQSMTIIERNDNLTDAHEWELLKSCKHQIIANSSFSWWAAYLNSNDNKIIVSPKAWYNDPYYHRIYNLNRVSPKSWKLF